MSMVKDDPATGKTIGEIIRLCDAARLCGVDVEKKDEQKQIKEQIKELCKRGTAALSKTGSPALAIVLMDAYEITQDGDMLQAVLDAASQMMPRLLPSKESVRLLSYCYYYVEDEECGILARKMLEELRGDKDFSEADRIFRELVGNH